LQNKFSEEYAPAEDTFFLAEHITKESGHSALDMGTGSGYLATILQQNFDFVVATDIDFAAIKGQKNKIQNSVCCDGANALKQKFDLVVCNLPYLPSEKIIDKTTDGGPQGLPVPLGMIQSASSCVKSGGKMLFLTSSLANYQKLMEKARSMGFLVTIAAKKKLFFEELILVEAKSS
jgi:release factor glutamine methyltransferase